MSNEETVPAQPLELDKVIHEPARLQIVAQLYVVEEADYLFLVRQTGLTWGNMSSHLSKLEAAGYVTLEKGYAGKKPQTVLRLTPEGRGAFDQYRRRLRGLLDAPGGH
jgi:DNA-binding transcriptional ArsR family regulator